jgi:hypothetical protein
LASSSGDDIDGSLLELCPLSASLAAQSPLMISICQAPSAVNSRWYEPEPTGWMTPLVGSPKVMTVAKSRLPQMAYEMLGSSDSFWINQASRTREKGEPFGPPFQLFPVQPGG